jgi:hypothetical protein
MTREQAIEKVAELRKLVSKEVEWNFGYMTEKGHDYLDLVQKIENEFNLPDSTPK